VVLQVLIRVLINYNIRGGDVIVKSNCPAYILRIMQHWPTVTLSAWAHSWRKLTSEKEP